VLEFLVTSRDTTLEALLEAAMLREYSATPWEGFFTGGGMHYFQNFDKADNGRVLSVRQAFHRSVNLVFIRMMRDIVEHYRVRVPGSAASILEDPEHPLRRAYLERFADREGADFLRRYYREYRGTGPEAALAAVVADTRPIPSRLAAVHRSTRPDASFEEFEQFLRSTLPHASIEERDARRWFEELAPERLSLSDRGYVARVHPLELWLVEYLARQPEASLADVLESSAGARQEVYSWLHRTGHKQAQDRRIRTLLEVEAFVEIHRAWRLSVRLSGALLRDRDRKLGGSARGARGASRHPEQRRRAPSHAAPLASPLRRRHPVRDRARARAGRRGAHAASSGGLARAPGAPGCGLERHRDEGAQEGRSRRRHQPRGRRQNRHRRQPPEAQRRRRQARRSAQPDRVVRVRHR
jgi:membrane peptidoglycan carboxypeptidase